MDSLEYLRRVNALVEKHGYKGKEVVIPPAHMRLIRLAMGNKKLKKMMKKTKVKEMRENNA